MRIEVNDGVMSPRFYGLAYYDSCCRLAVCYPIPLNVLVRMWRNIVWAFKRGLVKDKISVDYNIGYSKGFHEGYLDGRRDWSK